MLRDRTLPTFRFLPGLAGAYVEAMGGFWRQCNARSAPEKLRVPHRECMRARMPEARQAETNVAAKAGVRLQPPTLMRAVYGGFEPALIVMLRLPWERMHAAYYNYVHYRGRWAAGMEPGADSPVHPASPGRLARGVCGCRASPALKHMSGVTCEHARAAACAMRTRPALFIRSVEPHVTVCKS